MYLEMYSCGQWWLSQQWGNSQLITQFLWIPETMYIITSPQHLNKCNYIFAGTKNMLRPYYLFKSIFI